MPRNFSAGIREESCTVLRADKPPGCTDQLGPSRASVVREGAGEEVEALGAASVEILPPTNSWWNWEPLAGEVLDEGHRLGGPWLGSILREWRQTQGE